MMCAMQTGREIKELLNFYIEAGVDEVVGEKPVNHFTLPPPAQTAANPKSQQSSLRKPTISATQTLSNVAVPVSKGIEDAKDIAAACTTVEELQAAVHKFEGCSLKKMATTTVFARGNVDADVMIIDRPAHSEEDRSGSPFAGSSGIMLQKMMNAIGLSEDKLYLGCCLPWRPPGGRTPTKEEQALCHPFILKHIELVAPQTVILMGEAAAFLLQKNVGINKLRGNWCDLNVGTKTVPTFSLFHPAFLEAHPASKKQAWHDLLNLKAALAEKA